MNQDKEHLNLLAIFHYVVGGLAALFACFPIFHLIIGIIFIISPVKSGNEVDTFVPVIMGWMFVIMASIFILAGWAFALCMILAGRFLSKRKHYTFCLVMAGIGCLFMPFGTVLGVFTIIVLLRSSVKELFT